MIFSDYTTEEMPNFDAVWNWMTHGPVILRNIMIKLERAGVQYDYRCKTDEENTGSEWI